MRVYLRALELSDVDQLVKWRNDLAVTTSLGGNTYFVSNLRETEWVKNAILNDDKNIRLAICLKDNDQYIGNVNLTSINWINRSAEFSIMIGEKNQWRKGYGTEATSLILTYAFEEINLHRVYLTVRDDNKSAITLYEQIGFQHEGILRQSIYKNNRYIDLYIFSILKTEFNGQI
jgi:RimJ/RimL family protein N-acetyltransferase